MSTPGPLTPPFAATDIVAFVLAVLGALYLVLWRRDREPGLGWCAAAAFAFALWSWQDGRSASSGEHLRATYWHLPVVLGLSALSVGLIDYFGLQGRQRQRALAATLGPMALALGIVVWVNETGAQVHLAWPQSLIGLVCIVLAMLAMLAGRREPDAGHHAIGVALLAIPLLAIALRLAGLPDDLLRYTGTLPVLALCLTLLTVSLQRRRRALEAEIAERQTAEAELAALAESLEQRVARRTEELQQVIGRLESFNRSVSHDLRGPLGGIAGLARLAEEQLHRGDTGDALRYLPLIARQADASAQLLAALLELARVDDAPLERQPVDLTAVAVDAARALQSQRPEAVPAIDIGALPPVEADPALIAAVFTNLIGNAVKFCGGRPDAKIAVTGQVEGRSVTVHVADNGEGFDPACAGQLFKPFERLHGDRFAGHGVGLSIVRRAVERHGGQVWAAGRPGRGATFSFSLPLG